MSYWQTLKNNYLLWKRFNNLPEGWKQFGKIPSETYFKYPPFDDFKGKKVLNIGCGKCVYKAPNVVNTDLYPGEGVNAVLDLSKTPFPFEDNTFDLIIANHVIEHIPNWFECFKELARIVKVGGEIAVWVPPVSSDTAHTYRDHVNRIGVASFAGCKTLKRAGTNLTAAEEFKSIGHVADLRIVDTKARFIMAWWTLLAPPRLIQWMSDHLRNVITEEGYIFRKEAPNAA